MNVETKSFSIALVSSGLGHVKRGIETWTDDLGKALSKRGYNVTVYKGAGKPEYSYEKTARCLKRTSPLNKWAVRTLGKIFWRIGFGSGYQLEELTFFWSLLPHLLWNQYDIIHTQDPHVADNIRKTALLGLIKSKVILAHGTEETHAFLGKFDYLQHLAPFHKEETESHGFKGKKWFAIGNFIDTEHYKPGRQAVLRQKYNIPEHAFVVVSVAAIKRTHKRIDHLIKEMAKIDRGDVYMVVAGSKGDETPEIIELGEQLLGDKAIFISDFPHERIHEIYAMSDVFALCSLKDMMPIALLEGLSSGVPAITHTYPVEEWMIGKGGEAIDMTKEGELATTLTKYMTIDYRQAKSAEARKQAVENFSEDMILKQILDMYTIVLQP